MDFFFFRSLRKLMVEVEDVVEGREEMKRRKMKWRTRRMK